MAGQFRETRWGCHAVHEQLSRSVEALDIRLGERAGALTLFAGTSDEVGTTNLFGVDLYADPASAIKNLRATRRNPFEFWQNAGFTVVGLMPDAEGEGKPGIHMARRL